MTYFKPKNMGDVRLRLGGIADDAPVKLGPGVKLPPVRKCVPGCPERRAGW